MRKLLALLAIAAFFAVGSFAATATAAEPSAKTDEKPAVSSPSGAIGQQIQEIIANTEILDVEPEETFGTRALGLLITLFEAARDEAVAFASGLGELSQIGDWLENQYNDPLAIEKWLAIWEHLLLAVGTAVAAWWLADMALLPLRRRVTRSQPQTTAARFRAILAWLAMALIPVVLFVAAALIVLGQSDPPKLVRLVVMTVVYALAILRLIRIAVLFLFSPRLPALRIVPLSCPQAKYVSRWLMLLSGIMVFGYFGSDVAGWMKAPASAIAAFNGLIWLMAVTLTIIVIIQKRGFVSNFLRGDIDDPNIGHSIWNPLRLMLAKVWHVLAIAYLLIGYLVTASDGGAGLALMQRGTILTLLSLLAAWLATRVLDRLLGSQERRSDALTAGIYKPVLRWLLTLAAWVLALAGTAAAWGADVAEAIASPWGQRIMGSAFSITSTIVAVVLVYEILHVIIERRLNRRNSFGQTIEVNQRARTILPLVRNVAMMVLGLIAGLVTLSELGVNTAPLLAGAGIIGVAVGFGSQTLVKDFLTGLFILMENTIAIGDDVTIGNDKGVVEGMTIRTVRLRDSNGAVHILPFSEITRIVNQNRGFSYAVIDVGVAYESDLEKVVAVMRKTGEELLNGVEVGHLILDPIEVMGIENLADSAIIMRCRIKTVANKHGDVRRAYLLRLKRAFDDAGISIPYPTVMQLQK